MAQEKNNTQDIKKCNAVKELFNSIDWCDDISTKLRIENIGCKKNVSQAIDWAFNEEEQLIILEDDVVPSISFYKFCDEMLALYKNNENIYQVCGYNVLQNNDNSSDSYYFSSFPVIWGWATWKKKWNRYDGSLANMVNKDARQKILLRYKYKKHGLYIYNQINKTYKSEPKGQGVDWDYAWSFSAQYNDGIFIMPTKNLVQNIGFGEDALHGGRSDSPFAKPKAHEIDFPLNHPQSIRVNFDTDAKTIELHFKNGYPYWYVYGSRMFRFIFRRNMNSKAFRNIRRIFRKFVTRKE